MKKAILILVVILTSVSCKKEEIKPNRALWATIRFKIGTVYKWNHYEGVKVITVKVHGEPDRTHSIDGAIGYAESPCNSFGLGYHRITSDKCDKAHYKVISDRGETLAEGILIFKDPKEDVRI